MFQRVLLICAASSLWVACGVPEDQMFFRGESEAVVAKGDYDLRVLFYDCARGAASCEQAFRTEFRFAFWAHNGSIENGLALDEKRIFSDGANSSRHVTGSSANGRIEPRGSENTPQLTYNFEYRDVSYQAIDRLIPDDVLYISHNREGDPSKRDVAVVAYFNYESGSYPGCEQHVDSSCAEQAIVDAQSILLEIRVSFPGYDMGQGEPTHSYYGNAWIANPQLGVPLHHSTQMY